jgi:hypothetical protein
VLVAAFVAQSPTESSLVGEYVVDASHASGRDRPVIKQYFRGQLIIEPGGRFDLPTINMQGFWRLQGERLILTYTTTLNGPPVLEPDDLIRHKQPASPYDGHSMAILSDGTLSLADLGATQGPIYFFRVPQVPIQKLAEEAQLPGPEPLATLDTEGPRRWVETLAVVQDRRQPYAVRRVAAFSLRNGMNATAEKDVLTCLESLNTVNLKGDEVADVRQLLAESVAECAGRGLTIGLLADAAKFGIDKAILARGIARAKITDEIPRLIEWAHSDTAPVAVAALKALADLHAKEGLSIIRAQATAGDPDIKLAGNAALLRMSSDPAEQAKAVETILSLKGLSGHSFINNDIIEALGGSGCALAVAPLVDFLSKSPDPFDRRHAAKALGDLGSREALPALISASQAPGELKLDRTQSVEQQYAAVVASRNAAKTDGWVRKNAIDSIYRIEHPAG